MRWGWDLVTDVVTRLTRSMNMGPSFTKVCSKIEYKFHGYVTSQLSKLLALGDGTKKRIQRGSVFPNKSMQFPPGE